MKTTHRTGVLSILTTCALYFGANAAFAQNDPIAPPPPPVPPVEVLAVQPPTNSAATDQDESVESRKGVRHEAIVVFGKDVVLKAGDSAGAVVVIGGSAKILGKCDECVVIGGDLEIEGAVRHSAVAVLGTVRALKGAVLGGDVVGVGGGVEIADGATVSRRPVDINFSGIDLEWVKEWLVQCVLKMRPLAPQIGWGLGSGGRFSPGLFPHRRRVSAPGAALRGRTHPQTSNDVSGRAADEAPVPRPDGGVDHDGDWSALHSVSGRCLGAGICGGQGCYSGILRGQNREILWR